MRKLLALLTACALAITCSACATNEPTMSSLTDKRFGLTDLDISAIVITDGVTGVKYVVLQNGHGGITMCPVMLPDGTPQRVDNADYDDVKADIDANERRWTEEYDAAQIAWDNERQ